VTRPTKIEADTSAIVSIQRYGASEPAALLQGSPLLPASPEQFGDVSAAENHCEHQRNDNDVEQLGQAITAIWRKAKPSFDEVHAHLRWFRSNNLQ
jgi:hypothetical protein